jgi:hypothetical protein
LQFLQIKTALDEYLHEATERIIREEVFADSEEAGERDGSPANAAATLDTPFHDLGWASNRDGACISRYRAHVSWREIEYPICRRIEFSSQTALKQFHCILQIAMILFIGFQRDCYREIHWERLDDALE